MLILGINKVLNHLQITTGGRRYTCSMKDIPVKSSSMFELKDSLRSIGVKLYKIFEKEPGYNKCQCTIKFTATIDEKGMEVSYNTMILPGELK